ncbi:MAG: methyltransferase domain-containing protein [Chloroflexota bacterium]
MNAHPPICDYEGSDYQRRFWERGDRAYEDQVEAVAIQRLLPPGGKLLLEIGAGAGRNTSRYGGFERIVLLDYSRSQLRQAQERLGCNAGYIFVAADVYHLPFVEGLFDGATMIRVMHHLADVPMAISQVRHALLPGAVLILEYANKHNLKAIFRYLVRRQSWSPFTLEPVEFVPLHFNFHPEQVRSWLQSEGFIIERQLTVSHFRLGILKQIVPLRLLVYLDSVAQWTGNWWQFSPSVFVRARASRDSGQAAAGAFFRCPECGHDPLEEAPAWLRCNGCGRRWSVEDGIYDFRLPMNG